jgi:hypothetical protein
MISIKNSKTPISEKSLGTIGVGVTFAACIAENTSLYMMTRTDGSFYSVIDLMTGVGYSILKNINGPYKVAQDYYEVDVEIDVKSK